MPFAGTVFAQGAAASKTVIPVEKDYYLTPTHFTGAEASSACADGYHFANMWEISGLANLSYNIELGYAGPLGADWLNPLPTPEQIQLEYRHRFMTALE